jgi:ribokinase
MTHPKRIIVIGSINMDLVCRTPRIPRAGETILGDDLITIPGGKGANQAVAAARLAGPGVEVHFVGRVGEDDFGQRLLHGLTHNGVHAERVTVTEDVSSGCAMIIVNKKGENSIVVAPGANAKLSPADIDRAYSLIAGASAVVMQLEVPLETIRHAIGLCQSHGVFTILDPAPVPPRGFARELLAVDVLTPNQGEAEMLVGHKRTLHVSKKRLSDPKVIGIELVSRGPRNVVLKMGARGAMVIGRDDDFERIKAHKVSVVDTTAAGDAFTAALAVGHAEGMSLGESVRFANAAGAACCMTFGAQPSLPTRRAVIKLLRQSD